MGHANTTNISRCLNRLLKRENGATVREVVDELERTKQAVHAGEGDLTDRCMLGYMVEMLMQTLLGEALVEPMAMSRQQKAILKQWRKGDDQEWDSGDDGEGGQYAVLDSIRWRAMKKRLPAINYVEN